MIFTYCRYVDKMTAIFNQKTAAIEKMMASQTAVRERKEEMIQNEADLRPKLALLIEKTKILQEQVNFCYKFIRVICFKYAFMFLAILPIISRLNRKYRRNIKTDQFILWEDFDKLCSCVLIKFSMVMCG